MHRVRVIDDESSLQEMLEYQFKEPMPNTRDAELTHAIAEHKRRTATS